MENRTVEITSEAVRLPRRAPGSHKGDYGRVLIIGGSVGYTGAPVLSARAASKCGAGLTYAGVPRAIYEITAAKLTEEMPFPLPDKDGKITAEAADEILRRAGLCDVCLLGPGLGMSDGIVQLVSSVIQSIEIPLIIDADGLNAVSKNIDVLSNAACPLILTPHPGEFKRLCGVQSERTAQYVIVPSAELTSMTQGSAAPRPCSASDDNTEQSLNAATAFAEKHNCILVLKGHRTVTALPDGSAYVNTTGGPALAKGGSGDVLAGMIAAFVAQQAAGSLDFTAAGAVSAAVYLHGLAGDMCAEVFGEYSVAASDIIDMLPKALSAVSEKCN